MRESVGVVAEEVHDCLDDGVVDAAGGSFGEGGRAGAQEVCEL